MNTIIKTEDEYEDLLALWSDLESGLGVLLSHPASIQEFALRLNQYDRWMQDLLKRDVDIGLYLLFQLAIHSPVGYSASHALVCAVLCHLLAEEFKLKQRERDSLILAALTMNIAMTELQDELANQRTSPSLQQQLAIRSHAAKSAALISNLGIKDELWIETIQLHHKNSDPRIDLDSLTPPHRLAHILQVVDRYAAMISPRESREGRSAAESAQSIIGSNNEQDNPVGHSLVRIVGLFPPGTFVQLDDDKVAVVMRRSEKPNLPNVAIVLNDKGRHLKPPQPHRTADGSPVIKGALPAAAMHERINHHVILQMGMRSQ